MHLFIALFIDGFIFKRFESPFNVGLVINIILPENNQRLGKTTSQFNCHPCQLSITNGLHLIKEFSHDLKTRGGNVKRIIDSIWPNP